METVIAGRNTLIGSLQELITLNDDAIEALSLAIARVGDPADRGLLKRLLEDHHRHLLELEALARDLGAEAPESGRRAATSTNLRGLIGDRAVLDAIKMNEDDACAAYERAALREGLPENVRTLLGRGLANERRHRDSLAAELDAAGGLLLLLL